MYLENFDYAHHFVVPVRNLSTKAKMTNLQLQDYKKGFHDIFNRICDSFSESNFD